MRSLSLSPLCINIYFLIRAIVYLDYNCRKMRGASTSANGDDDCARGKREWRLYSFC